jgi:hypothetical protein
MGMTEGKKHKVYEIEEGRGLNCVLHKNRGHLIPATWRVLTFEAGMRTDDEVCDSCLNTYYSIEPGEYASD